MVKYSDVNKKKKEEKAKKKHSIDWVGVCVFFLYRTEQRICVAVTQTTSDFRETKVYDAQKKCKRLHAYVLVTAF